jgi:hypothetical protein
MAMKDQAVVFEVPEDGEVTRREIGGIEADVYSPATSSDAAVVIVSGYPDEGFQRVAGCRFMEMRHTASWARLFAASGFTAVAYSNRGPVTDLKTVMREVRSEFRRVVLFATSGNVPTALSAIGDAAGAVFLYGYMLDVAEAAAAFRFANPALAFDDLRWDVPLFIARAGKDQMPRLNESIDRFVAEGLKRGLPLTLVNHPHAPHAFDLMDDSETSRHVVRQAIEFLRFSCGAGFPARAPGPGGAGGLNDECRMKNVK